MEGKKISLHSFCWNATRKAMLHSNNGVLLSEGYQQGQKRKKIILSEDMYDLRFSWAGSTETGKQHYYRIQGKTFLIEFDNTQNNGNYIHSIWRDFDGDFGRDLLMDHYHNTKYPH